ncbi:DUF3768 domain-containing protein [Rhizobium hidalgonense]|uniref:DUF3768 domain-containing protein n=1 Tax=Rhizobium hidalgonense TaxID=1538159 RepID=A0ABX4JJJ0_9HYPH|nr:DUF3768 domain-containing protein [Rhizobium hidalgonense]PDT20045.1 hypothetical protein CO674_29800 [Rhizobium hidalgonense]PON05923.1 hypothetical protein ATY29_19230 [Rhizobium hidalgonense]
MRSLAVTSSPDQQAAVERTATIRALNDTVRRNPTVGRAFITPAVCALPHDQRLALLRAVVGFTAFDAGNDPHNEHDFGAIELDGVSYFWKIDYFDQVYDMGSPDPANPHVTRRVLTIMRADEY